MPIHIVSLRHYWIESGNENIDVDSTCGDGSTAYRLKRPSPLHLICVCCRRWTQYSLQQWVIFKCPANSAFPPFFAIHHLIISSFAYGTKQSPLCLHRAHHYQVIQINIIITVFPCAVHRAFYSCNDRHASLLMQSTVMTLPRRAPSSLESNIHFAHVAKQTQRNSVRNGNSRGKTTTRSKADKKRIGMRGKKTRRLSK